MGMSSISENSTNSQSPYLSDSNPGRTPSSSGRTISREQEQIERERIESEREAQQTLNHIKDSYEKQIATETARNDELLETQRNRGYENIRDLKRSQQAEISKMRKTGEDDIAQ